jgi:hypothetical protein
VIIRFVHYYLYQQRDGVIKLEAPVAYMGEFELPQDPSALSLAAGLLYMPAPLNKSLAGY